MRPTENGVTDATATGQTDAIAFAFDLRHPPEKVWRALTEPALLKDWLLPVVEGTLEPGAGFIFQTEPHPGWDGTVHCRVLEIERHRTLRYSWVVGGMLDTVVTFSLTPTADGTHVTLVQSGFRPEQKQNFGGARYGWRMMGGKLVALLERIT